ncbi:MAG: hypothetical protein ACLRP3_19140 [Escherichia sp.]
MIETDERDGGICRDGFSPPSLSPCLTEQHGKFIAVGLTDILESSGLSGIPAFVGLALLSFFMHVYRQRFRNLVDSGPIRTNVYAIWLSFGI